MRSAPECRNRLVEVGLVEPAFDDQDARTAAIGALHRCVRSKPRVGREGERDHGGTQCAKAGGQDHGPAPQGRQRNGPAA